MVTPLSLRVRCQYYDQNPDVAGMVTIYYSRPFEELLLLKDTKIYLDERGQVEDFHLHGGESIKLEER